MIILAWLSSQSLVWFAFGVIVLLKHPFTSKISFLGSLLCLLSAPQSSFLSLRHGPVPFCLCVSTGGGGHRLEDSPVGAHCYPSALLSVSVPGWTRWAFATLLQNNCAVNTEWGAADEMMFPSAAPSVEVFQPSNMDHCRLGNQLQKWVSFITLMAVMGRLSQSLSQLYCQFCHMYRTDPKCEQISRHNI